MGKPEKQITKEQLEQLYVKEGRSTKEVAAFFDCSPGTIRHHLVRKGIRVRSQSEVMRGRKLSPQHRAKVIKTLSSQRDQMGSSNPAWKGGRSSKGRKKDDMYTIIRIDGKYVPEHRWVVEQNLGRKLHPREHIHHIDGNKRNNDSKNLLVLTASAHAKLHMTDEHKEHLSNKMREIRKQRFWSSHKL